MCTEFLLAIIYFLIILIINYLLFRLIKTYQQDVIHLVKYKKILKNFSNQNLELVIYLRQILKKDLKIPVEVSSIQNFSNTKDILIIGNMYKFFSTSERKQTTKNFYFKLKELQYLS